MTIDYTYISIYKESFSTLKTSLIEILETKGCQSQLGSYIICSVIYTTTGHRRNELEKNSKLNKICRNEFVYMNLDLNISQPSIAQVIAQSMLTSEFIKALTVNGVRYRLLPIN